MPTGYWIPVTRSGQTKGAGRMAEEEKGTNPPEESEHKEERKTETTTETREQPSERRTDSPARTEREPATTTPEREDCPECDAPILTGKMGTHRYRAHGVERRAAKDDKRDKATSKRRPPPGDDNKDEDDKETPPPASRWAEVRSSW